VGADRPGPERRPPGRRVAVLAPMDVELRPLVRRARLRPDTPKGAGQPRLWRGRVGTTEIVATRIGMGPATAAAATRRLLDLVEVDDVVVMGVAGGLAPAAVIGSVVIPAVVVDGATGSEYRPTSALLPGPSGMILTTATAILDPAAHADWAGKGFTAVDMESSGVAAACDERDVPWTVVRAISDRPDQGIVDSDVVALSRADGSPDLPAVCRFLLRRPWRVKDLVTLARGLRAATTAATETVLAACAPAAGDSAAAVRPSRTTRRR